MIAASSKETPVLITIGQAAELCSVSYWTMWRKVNSGELESVKLTERTKRIPRDSLDRYLAKIRQQG